MPELTPTAVAGRVLSGVFDVLASLRGGKPLHHDGVLYDALVRRTGSSQSWGCPWLDEPGVDSGVARLSRAIGLPEAAPDILGLAVTFTDDRHERHDMLLATTGTLPGIRHVLVPRYDPRTASYTSLLPYQTPAGLALIAATPTLPPEEPAGVAGFRLQAAGLLGSWEQFGVLELTERPEGSSDEAIRFDPIRHPLPGLRWPRPLNDLREPAYAAARRTPAARQSAGDRAHRSS